MFFLTIFSFLTFRFVYNVEINKRDFIIPVSFGFDIGGNYSIKIFNGSNDRILLHIGIINDIKQYWIDKNGYNPCNIAIPNENIYIIKNQNSSLSGVIKKAGIYEINVKTCAYYSSNYTIELKFQNPASNLSSESQFYLKTFEKQLIISFLLFMIWIYNVFHSPTNLKTYNILITILLFLFVVNKILLIFEYKICNQTD